MSSVPFGSLIRLYELLIQVITTNALRCGWTLKVPDICTRLVIKPRQSIVVVEIAVIGLHAIIAIASPASPTDKCLTAKSRAVRKGSQLPSQGTV